MIELRNITKRFGKFEVLRDIELRIPKGQVTALVGPNGSGKTTLVKCILGLIRPSSGSVLVDGNPVHNDSEYRRLIGYMPQIARFPEHLRVRDVLSLVARVRADSGAACSSVTNLFGLNGETSKRLGALSGGNRQKVSALIAAQFQPQIYILDEPTAGLDPISSRRLKDYIRAKRDEGCTVILTSHIMTEIEELADNVVFLLDGRILFRGSPDEIRRSAGEEKLEAAVARLLERVKT